MNLTVHDVKSVEVRTVDFDNLAFVTKDLTILGKDGKELLVVTLFGETKEDLKLSIKNDCSIM
jgi:hypothetical protein